MTIEQILSKIKQLYKHDAYDCFVWLEWFCNKDSCRDCIEEFKTPNCLSCIPSTTLIRKRNKMDKSVVRNNPEKRS
jgi:hypothetical protein